MMFKTIFFLILLPELVKYTKPCVNVINKSNNIKMLILCEELVKETKSCIYFVNKTNTTLLKIL